MQDDETLEIVDYTDLYHTERQTGETVGPPSLTGGTLHSSYKETRLWKTYSNRVHSILTYFRHVIYFFMTHMNFGGANTATDIRVLKKYNTGIANIYKIYI